MPQTQVGEVSAALAIAMNSIRRGALPPKDARYITNAVNGFTKLSRLSLKYLKANGRELDLPELPRLETLIDHLKNDRVPQAVAEAKAIREATDRIIQQAKTALAD